ncbi:MAG: septum formation protein Maf [Elusimicrobia bacterium]|nr:septum formation protein Maf [Elusimicrobiota bacterium]
MSAARPLILASQSPQRRTLLKALRVPFRIIRPGVSERSAESRPRRLALELALRKARAVAGRLERALVLGADTIVVCRGKILGKPRGGRDAVRMLTLLNGSWHRVYTGVALVDAASGRSWREVAVTRVKARRLPATELARLADRHLDKAGGYAMQDKKDPFIEKVVGPVDNVIGLPLASVRKLIRKAATE